MCCAEMPDLLGLLAFSLLRIFSWCPLVSFLTAVPDRAGGSSDASHDRPGRHVCVRHHHDHGSGAAG